MEIKKQNHNKHSYFMYGMIVFAMLFTTAGLLTMQYGEKLAANFGLGYNSSAAGGLSGGTGFIDNCDFSVVINSTPEKPAPGQTVYLSASVDYSSDGSNSCAFVKSLNVDGSLPNGIRAIRDNEQLPLSFMKLYVDPSFRGESLTIPLTVKVGASNSSRCEGVIGCSEVDLYFSDYSLMVNQQTEVFAVRHAATFDVPARGGLAVMYGKGFGTNPVVTGYVYENGTSKTYPNIKVTYASDTQINFLMPEAPIDMLEVRGSKGVGSISSFALYKSAPGIFTISQNGKGFGTFFTSNGTPISNREDNPATFPSELYTLTTGGIPVVGSLYNTSMQNIGDIKITKVEAVPTQPGVNKVTFTLPGLLSSGTSYKMQFCPAALGSSSACGNIVDIKIKPQSSTTGGGSVCSNTGLGITSATNLGLLLRLNGNFKDDSRVNVPNIIKAEPNGDLGFEVNTNCPRWTVLNGTNNYVSVSSNAGNIEPSLAFTIQTRVKVDLPAGNIKNWQGIVMKDEVVNNNRAKGFGLYYDGIGSAKQVCGFIAPYSSSSTVCASMSAGAWHNVTFDLVPTGTSLSAPAVISIRVDNSAPVSKQLSNSFKLVKTAKPMLIGASSSATGVTDYLKGSVDEVRFYTRSLTDAEIRDWQKQ